jgi:hypothetical protein
VPHRPSCVVKLRHVRAIRHAHNPARATHRLGGDHRTVFTGILGDLAQRGPDRLAAHLDPEALVVVVGSSGQPVGMLQLAQDQRRPSQGNTAATDACLDRHARGVRLPPTGSLKCDHP